MRKFVVGPLSALFLALSPLGGTACAEAVVPWFETYQQLRDQVIVGLEAGDYDRVDQLLADEHKHAVATREFTPLRNTYGTVFVVVNRERFAQANDWLAAKPDSPYAAAALAWLHYKRAWEYRGNSLVRYVSAEAWDHFRVERDLAEEMAERALEEGDDFLPAIDALLQLRRIGGNKMPVSPLVMRALNVAPGRHALLLGLQALDPKWGGNPAEVAALCADAVPKIPDYSEELCLIDTVFTLGLSGAARATALGYLDKQDEAFLDNDRLDAYLNEWRDRPEAKDEAMRILDAQGGNASEWELNAYATQFGRRDYYEAMHPKLRENMRDRLAYSPQESSVVGWLADDIMRRHSYQDPLDAPKEAFAMWLDTLELSAFDGNTWLLGSHIDSIANGAWDYERRKPFFENAIYYSNYRPYAFSEYMMFLGQLYQIATNPKMRVSPGVAFDDAKIEAATSCEMVRAVRFFYEACQMNPSDRGCRTFGVVEEAIASARKLLDEEGCERERTAPLEELAYSPVPIENFSAILGQ